MVLYRATSWFPAEPHNSISSTGKWPGGTFSPPLEICPACTIDGPNWVDELPWILLGIRTAPKEDLGTSSAELVYGVPITVPGDFFSKGQH